MSPVEVLASQLRPDRGWKEHLSEEFRQPYMQGLAEFLAADTCSNIRLAHELAHGVADNAQNLIPNRMSVGIVDLFEVVKIQHQQGEVLLKTQCASKFLIQLRHEVTAVE